MFRRVSDRKGAPSTGSELVRRVGRRACMPLPCTVLICTASNSRVLVALVVSMAACCARLATDAAAASLEAADLDSDLLLSRGSAGQQLRRSARHHAPLPLSHRPVASVFAQEEHQVGWPRALTQCYLSAQRRCWTTSCRSRPQLACFQRGARAVSHPRLRLNEC